jgi:hypothetical protein
MKKLILVFVLSLLIVVCLTNCNKTKTQHLYISQFNKDIAVFNKNSYWVYLNEKTSKVDCTYIKSDPRFYTTTEQDGSSETDNILVPFDGSFFLEEFLNGSMTGVILDAPVVHYGSIVRWKVFQ